MNSRFLAKIDHLVRPLATLLPPAFAVRLYSYGRRYFLRQYAREYAPMMEVPSSLGRNLWGIHFRSPLFNAAGMFKNGENYYLCARQGAGAYIAGTTTARPRIGNERNGIRLPFAPYPRSGAASNWLGLPNEGHAVVSHRLADLDKIEGCPIGASLMTDPDVPELNALAELVEGLHLYEQANVDFIEINESCPNAGHDHSAHSLSGLALRLEYIQRHFLRLRKRRLPVIVKFSSDTEPILLPKLIDMLISLEFDGINLGNTSTQYVTHGQHIHDKERDLYDYFTQTFGGGISGAPLRFSSLHLAEKAMIYLRKKQPAREFWVIRTGGVSTAADIAASDSIGIPLCQWYTGYFAAFAEVGHTLYEKLYQELLSGRYGKLHSPAYYQYPLSGVIRE